MRIAIAVSAFHSDITEKLLNGAQECLRQHGAREGDAALFRCPGAFELPQIANKLAEQKRWDAVICLGAVIRGETPHFDYVASQSAAGIQQTALKHGLPVIFGVLTTDNVQQAADRAGGKHGNKGWDAALTAIEMIALFKDLKRTPGRSSRRKK
jgi:6,7-dimethyl-8-ribityllumazine synthase